jgi:hypothetical protein
VAVPSGEIRVSAFPLVFRGRSIAHEDTFAFRVLENIHPMNRNRPLAPAEQAYSRMMGVMKVKLGFLRC